MGLQAFVAETVRRSLSEKEGYPLGVRGYQLGPSFAPVAYLLKKLDLTTQRWAFCIRALAAVELLIRLRGAKEFHTAWTVMKQSATPGSGNTPAFSGPPKMVNTPQGSLLSDPCEIHPWETSSSSGWHQVLQPLSQDKLLGQVVMAHTFNPSTGSTELVPGQLRLLHRETLS
ncbi:protein FAM104B isoform X1 [Cricetulus griseus]|uniref:protein FAM104B isoform X1 n=1 Tax=Cricetulus griseus TaxID=10029 RepID=UPI00045463E3|nr:protein FAM104B isoform X1 [Cricetulus griseus]XP_027290871.1 protein FAM104B isoform X1 [Cricetulus griseus]XP_035310240.1 protein FAM104B isoform X1 [Cricetulus griseus]